MKRSVYTSQSLSTFPVDFMVQIQRKSSVTQKMSPSKELICHDIGIIGDFIG